MLQRRAGLMWVVAALMSAPLAGHADEPKAESARPAPAADTDIDEELLEFLGSIDSEDADWIDYLSRTDIVQVAKEPERKPTPKAVKSDGNE